MLNHFDVDWFTAIINFLGTNSDESEYATKSDVCSIFDIKCFAVAIGVCLVTVLAQIIAGALKVKTIALASMTSVTTKMKCFSGNTHD